MGIRHSEELVRSEFTVDGDGNPTGGRTVMFVGGEPESEGLAAVLDRPVVLMIEWQDGIIPPGESQNGAFVEDVLEAARQRLLWFNSHDRFRCRENSLAITKIEEALQWLDWRTRKRVAENVENTYTPHSE